MTETSNTTLTPPLKAVIAEVDGRLHADWQTYIIGLEQRVRDLEEMKTDVLKIAARVETHVHRDLSVPIRFIEQSFIVKADTFWRRVLRVLMFWKKKPLIVKAGDSFVIAAQAYEQANSAQTAANTAANT